jgi:SRSO17 transposase
MGLDTIAEGVDRFEVYLAGLKSVIGHANRTAPLHDYCLGLLATEGRKSVEPMASTASQSFGATSKNAALRCQFTVVRRAGIGQGARDRGAGD